MTVSFLYLAERAVMEMRKGEFDEILIKCSDGYFLIKSMDSELIFLAFLTDIHRIFFDFKRTHEKIANLI